MKKITFTLLYLFVPFLSIAQTVSTREFVYKTYPQYELTLTVDMPITDSEAAPFMVYIHGGGWARGDNSANRGISQRLARQGVAGVRIAYTLAPQPDATILVSIDDVRDAVLFIQAHASELGIDPLRFGFYGGSAGAHLAAVAAMTIPNTRVLVGNAGIYDLAKAKISARATQKERIAYFWGLDPAVLAQCSPVNLIPESIPAILLVHGTGDTTVEWQQSQMFYDALLSHGAPVLILDLRDGYQHNLTSSASDISAELAQNAIDFILKNL